MLWPRCGGIYTHEQRSRIRDEYIIDYILGLCHVSYIPAHLRGRLRRRAEGGAGSGVLRRRLVTGQPREARDPARQALRPGCEELALRIRRKCRRRKRGPRPKIATVERREASASRWTRAAPQEARPVAHPQRATTEIVRLSALRSPLMGADGKEESKTRAQQRAAGTKKTALFDIVNRNIAATRSVPAERAKEHARRVGKIACRGRAIRTDIASDFAHAGDARGHCAGDDVAEDRIESAQCPPYGSATSSFASAPAVASAAACTPCLRASCRRGRRNRPRSRRGRNARRADGRQSYRS